MNDTHKHETIRKALTSEQGKINLGKTLSDLIQIRLKRGLARRISNNSDVSVVCSIPLNGGIPRALLPGEGRGFEIVSFQETHVRNFQTNSFTPIDRLMKKAAKEIIQQEDTNCIGLIDHVAVHAVLSWNEIFEQLSPNEILISNLKNTSKNMFKTNLPNRVAYKIPKDAVILYQSQTTSASSADRWDQLPDGKVDAFIGYVFSEVIELGLSKTDGIYKYFVI